MYKVYFMLLSDSNQSNLLSCIIKREFLLFNYLFVLAHFLYNHNSNVIAEESALKIQ